MNIVEREWSVQPFRPSVTGKVTLTALVLDFQRRRVASWSLLYKNRDDIVDFCAESDSLQQAIERACRSKRANGKHHNHQSKVPAAILKQLERALVHRHTSLFDCRSFDSLYTIIDTLKPKGIGPVTTYDVAVRIGAYRHLTPQSVYLHAGAFAGLRALQQAVPMGPITSKVLPLDFFPSTMAKRLTADEIEDFLCVYRTVFPYIGRMAYDL